MADITMCNYKECKLSKTCYRFNANANPFAQAYLVEPKKSCADYEHNLYVKQKEKS